ncbi:hypothetical protein L1987_17215 [Smallanthus sonchifolius]|uniref:Uncharacterized protein n=1 Tax=Smallanthus sonchifolius TaxID=185202 RepID=A0ACB9IWW6_9ASTR|nr:hypothetical protein L1987_17215 [Smallanthus sonchifolius]
MSSGAETSQLEDVWTDNVDDCNEEQVEPLPTETAEDAAMVAAFQVYDAENKEEQLIKTCEDADKVAELLEESMAMLMLAEDLFAQCARYGQIILPP